MAKELLVWGVIFVALVVSLMIGVGLVEQTWTTVGGTVGYTSTLNTTHINSGTVFTTFTSYLPILVQYAYENRQIQNGIGGQLCAVLHNKVSLGLWYDGLIVLHEYNNNSLLTIWRSKYFSEVVGKWR